MMGQRRVSHPASRGFSQIETLACIVVASLLAALAAPAMSGQLRHSRATALQNALVGHLHLARQTAIWQRKPTLLCPSVDGKQCTTTRNWAEIWLVFTDPDGNGQPDLPTDIVRTGRQPAAATLNLRSSAGRSRVRYLPDGRNAGSNLTLSICTTTGQLLRQVVVNNSGRVRNGRIIEGATCPP